MQSYTLAQVLRAIPMVDAYIKNQAQKGQVPCPRSYNNAGAEWAGHRTSKGHLALGEGSGTAEDTLCPAHTVPYPCPSFPPETTRHEKIKLDLYRMYTLRSFSPSTSQLLVFSIACLPLEGFKM